MHDWMSLNLGLTTRQFCELLEKTVGKLVEAVESPANHDPTALQIARGALKALVQGPYHIPRDRKMAYADSLVHLLVARQGLYPGDVKNNVFDKLVVGIPEPARSQITEFSGHLVEGAPGLTDQELAAAARKELDERVYWRHPGRLALWERSVGLLTTIAVLAVVYFGMTKLPGVTLGGHVIDKFTSKLIFGLSIFFTISLNILLSIVFLRPAASKYGPPLVDLSSEDESQFIFMVNGTLKHATDIYAKQPVLAGLGLLGGCGIALWAVCYGQAHVEWFLSVLSGWGYWLWRAIH